MRPESWKPISPSSSTSVAQESVIGLIAGWGDYPLEVAGRCRENGQRVVCVGVAGHADPELARVCHEYRTFGLGRMGAQARFLKRRGVRYATMAGKIFKTRILTRFAWIRHTPDLTFWRFFYRQFLTGTENRNDDTMLLTVIRLFSSQGIDFFPATDFVPELLVKEGLLTRRPITDLQRKDIEFGWDLAKNMGGLDVGQSVAVKGRAVLAVEAIEGTDACIARAGQLCPVGGFTVVKVAKPQQDLRFDMPTIGRGTIDTMHAAGASVLAIEADMTIMLQQEEVVRRANELGITIVALNQQSLTGKSIPSHFPSQNSLPSDLQTTQPMQRNLPTRNSRAG